MANPQKENGYTMLANEIYDALARTRIPGEARQVLDLIIRRTYGFHKKSDQIATSQIMETTGLPCRAIEKARKNLRTWNLITTAKKGGSQILIYAFNKDYETWQLPPKKVQTTAKKGGQLPPKKRDTKDNKDNKDNKDTEQAPASLNQPQENPEVKTAMDAVLKEGFNIYAMVYKAKEAMKQSKAWRFPDQVILNVCAAYHKERERIREPYPWFLTVLKQETMAWNANNHEQESKTADKRGPAASSMQAILKGMT
jgi:phage replication O-like protein O